MSSPNAQECEAGLYSTPPAMLLENDGVCDEV